MPVLADADAPSLKPFVREWHKLALPHIDTKPFDETWIDFLRAWPRVKFPGGSEPIAIAFNAAVQAPTPAIAEQFEQPQVRLLASLCRELQRIAGSGPFFLTVRTAGKLLGVDHTTAWRWLYLLEQTGILLATERGSQATRKATRFRYLSPVTS